MASRPSQSRTDEAEACVKESTFVHKTQVKRKAREKRTVRPLRRSVSVAERFPEAPHKDKCKAIKRRPHLSGPDAFLRLLMDSDLHCAHEIEHM